MEHVRTLEEKMQNAFDENANQKQKENEKLWKGLESKFCSCDQLDLVHDAWKDKAIFEDKLSALAIHYLNGRIKSGNDKAFFEDKLSIHYLNGHINCISLKFMSAEEAIKNCENKSENHIKKDEFYSAEQQRTANLPEEKGTYILDKLQAGKEGELEENDTLQKEIENQHVYFREKVYQQKVLKLNTSQQVPKLRSMGHKTTVLAVVFEHNGLDREDIIIGSDSLEVQFEVDKNKKNLNKIKRKTEGVWKIKDQDFNIFAASAGSAHLTAKVMEQVKRDAVQKVAEMVRNGVTKINYVDLYASLAAGKLVEMMKKNKQKVEAEFIFAGIHEGKPFLYRVSVNYDLDWKNSGVSPIISMEPKLLTCASIGCGGYLASCDFYNYTYDKQLTGRLVKGLEAPPRNEKKRLVPEDDKDQYITYMEKMKVKDTFEDIKVGVENAVFSGHRHEFCGGPIETMHIYWERDTVKERDTVAVNVIESRVKKAEEAKKEKIRLEAQNLKKGQGKKKKKK